MKKQFLTTCAIAAISLLVANDSYGQWSTVNANDIETDPTVPVNNVYIQNNLGLGIPTINPPQYRLTVNGDMGFEQNPLYRHLFTNSNEGLAIYSNTNWNDGSGILLNSINGPAFDNGGITFVANPPSGTDLAFRFVDGAWNSKVSINGNGLMGIGTLPSSNFNEKLMVEQDIAFSANSSTTIYNALRAKAYNTGLAIYADEDWQLGSGILLNGEGNAANNPGAIDFVATDAQGSVTEAAFTFWKTDNAGVWTDKLVSINKAGCVGISTPPSSNTNEKLIVEQDIAYAANNSTTIYNALRAKAYNTGLAIYADEDWQLGSGILLNGEGNAANNPGAIDFVATDAQGSAAEAAFTFRKTNNQGVWTDKLLQINKNGETILDGEFKFKTNTGTTYRSISGQSINSGLAIYSNSAWTDGGGIMLNGNSNAGHPGSVTLVAGDAGQANEKSFIFAKWDANAQPNPTWNYQMSIANDGQVVIGNVNTVPYINNNPSYKLYVQTGILTEKVKVALSSDPTNWSDFVFNDDYELRSLSEVESYIKENKHLPEIPSTEEVHANGLDLAQMDAKLLQKIEELTLYIIQQQKEIEELKNRLNN